MKKVILIATSFVLLIVIGFSSYGFYKYKMMTSKWYEPLALPAPQASPKEPIQKQIAELDDKTDSPNDNEVVMKPFNLMILGVDGRKGERKFRSDTMMLAAINPKKKKVALVSIPRDTLAKIPGHREDKFNHSMFYGGPSLVKKTMEDFFGIQVNRYVTLDFDGFVKLINALGGIEVDVNRRMKYHDPTDGTKIDLKPGPQILSGKQALDYARFRKSEVGRDATDFERMERQRDVIRSISNKAVTFSSAFKIFRMMDILGEHVKTDLSEDEIHQLIRLFKDVPASSISSVEMKGTGKRLYRHGYNLWYYIIDDKERQRVKSLITDALSLP
jgi:polyisoprenyl-teichoic acid--peptidoglycan teichoic acid transferase